MPEITGVQFINKAKTLFEGKVLPKFILLTGYSDLETIMEAVNKGGIWRYLTKPWDQTELKFVLDNALDVYQIESDKLLAETELLESKERLQLAINSAGIGLWDWRLESDQIFLNSSYSELLGYSRIERIINTNEWFEAIHGDDRDVVMKTWISTIKNNEGGIACEFRLKKADDTYTWVLFEGKVVSAIHEASATRVVGVVRDITREKFEGERLIATILETEDKERKRLAKEIHDSLGQNLTAAFMHFEVVRLDMSSVDEKVLDNFNRGFSFLNTCINESREIAYNLMPKAISDYGYVSSVVNLLQGLKGASVTKFDFFTNLNEGRLKENIELGLYRITQEAINNILKYSEAANASLQLIEHEDSIQLSIEDNGHGFDSIKIMSAGSTMGLMSMENRAKALSGTFIIESAPGKGTYISVEVPKELVTNHQD
jgi:PAS domain S-box-containing protein